VRIKGKKIGIRPFQNEDVNSFYAAAIESTEHMKEFMPWCHSEYSIRESKEWVVSQTKAFKEGKEYSFIIYSLENQEFLGSVAINHINDIHKIGNIGYWIRKSSLNKGVATEAVSLVCSFGFTTLGLFRAEIVTLPNNKASRKVADKVGAKYEGILQNRLVVFGQPKDACMYSLVENKA
jgi:RimJ/RimL family protein N-acetyltransferase